MFIDFITAATKSCLQEYYYFRMPVRYIRSNMFVIKDFKQNLKFILYYEILHRDTCTRLVVPYCIVTTFVLIRTCTIKTVHSTIIVRRFCRANAIGESTTID